MTLDNQTLIFNLDKTFNLFNLSAKQFDTDNARSFTFKFIQNNTPFSLNGINVKVSGIKPDNTHIFNDVKIIDSTNGIVELDLTSQMLAANGVLKLEFIFMKDNVRLSSYLFEINIVPSVTNFNAIESSDEFGALTNALGSVEGTINNLTTKVNNAITNVTANQIGGTNLLTGTQWFDYGWVLGENGVDAKIDRTNLFQGCAVEVLWYDWNYFYQDVNYEVGKTYTISCYAKADKEGANIYFSLADNMTAWGMQKLTTEWEKYVFTFTPTLSTGSLRIECSGVSDNNKAYVSKIKLEKGTMATDWCPNYLDYKNQVGATNLIANSGQITDLKYWSLNKASNSTAELHLEDGINKGTHGVGASCEVGGDWCLLQNTSLGDNGFKFVVGESYTLSGVIWAKDTSKTIPFAICDDDGANQVFGTTYRFNKNNIYYDDPNYNKFEFTFVAELTGNQNKLRIQLSDGVKIFIPFIKLEKGYCATDWSLSPYDLKNLQNNQSNLLTSVNNNTKQIASNSSSINDLYGWVNRNIGMQYISGATSLTLQPNWSYYLDGQHVADITHIDHSAIPAGGKVYFYVASGDPLAHIVFRRQGLCNQDVRVWLPKGQDFWIVGNTDGDTIFTLMKIGDSMRFLS